MTLLVILVVLLAAAQLVITLLVLGVVLEMATTRKAEPTLGSQAVRTVHRETVRAMIQAARGEATAHDRRP